MPTVTSINDYQTAQLEADEIVGYWRKRGYVVHAKIERIAPGKRNPETEEPELYGWAVRTDMVCGMPRDMYEAAAQRGRVA